MSRHLKIITRVAIFAALVFIFSYFTVILANVNLAFFIVFSAGMLWGIWPGVAVGVIGFFFWSNFNPYGPAPLPILLSQLIGLSFSALIGFTARKLMTSQARNIRIIIVMIISGILCGLIYQLSVSVVDAWVFQPFWPRLISGLFFSLITIISNGIIFPVLYPVLAFIYARERLKGP
jgi:uncharacterized membrane protein